MSSNSSKTLRYQISWKSVYRFSSYHLTNADTDGQTDGNAEGSTDMAKLMGVFFAIFSCETNKQRRENEK
jgi:hypothetical protein